MTNNTLALAQLRALLRGEPMPTHIPPTNSAVAVAERPTHPPGWESVQAVDKTYGEYTTTLPPVDNATEAAATERALTPTLYKPVPGAKLVARKYQVEAIERLLSLKRGLVWDAPGLGKTFTSSEVAATQLPVLVSCPNYLTQQWYDYLCEQYPTHAICLIDGTRPERVRELKKKYDWFVTNHEMVRSYELPKVNTLIIDEGHHFRNTDSKQSKAMRKYSSPTQTPNLLILTATPLYKTPDNVFHLLHIIDPVAYPSYWKFVQKHCRTYNSGYGVQIMGVRNAELLYAEMRAHGIGRTYKEVELELPQLISRHIPVMANSAFMAKYKAIKTQWKYNEKDINSLMEAMHIMRRATAQPKLEHALELLQDEAEGVIFTWYVDTAKALAQILEIPCITGEMDASERQKVAKENKLVVGSMSAMSEGVDLSHLNHVIFFESDYVPARLYQALSRVRRHRQSSEPVRCTYLYVKNTIDEIVWHAAQTRNATIKSVMKQALLGEEGVSDN